MSLVRSLLLLLAVTSWPAAAEQVRFTGQTTADATLIRDALRNILLYGQALHQCTSLTAVEAAVLTGYQPSDPRYRMANAAVTYERWDALLCGRSVPFLVGFWPAPDGGTMFQVSHPYPAEAPSALQE